MNGDSYSRDGGRHGGSSRDYQSSRRDRDDRRGGGGADRSGGREGGGDRADRASGSSRRRSRSPYDRNRGSSRRDEGDVDTYSSSRRHQEREREDRYGGSGGGRERRPDREWDRDRGGRDRGGGRRRDDDRNDRRGGGGGRDLFDDRRGAGGRGGREGGGGRRGPGGDDFDQEMRGQARGRTASPAPKKREPTPDLTDVVPVTERKRRLTQWDIKPPGYENVTAEQAKLSGMFPLPGAPRQQAMDPTKLQAFMNQPGGNVNSAALKPTNSRQAKRLIVSNLPPTVTEEDITNFFNLQMNGLNVIDGTDPVVLCQLAPNHSFAMLEFRSSSDATVAYALDGITMEQHEATNGEAAPKGLSIKRPKDYIVPAVVDEVPYEPGVVSSVVVDTPGKISLTNIPTYLTDEQVLELLTSFGELKAFVLVKDRGTGESRGIAFCEYVDPAATEVAINGLNGMDLGEKRLAVRKASIGVTQVAGEMSVNAMSMLAGTTSTDPDMSRVLQLLNMVTPEELMDNDDYEEIKEDVQEECSKYGTVVELKIPRPSGPSRSSAGVGKIFVKYDTPESAQKALQALAGRKFADRTVVTTFFPEENFDVGAW